MRSLGRDGGEARFAAQLLQASRVVRRSQDHFLRLSDQPEEAKRKRNEVQDEATEGKQIKIITKIQKLPQTVPACTLIKPLIETFLGTESQIPCKGRRAPQTVLPTKQHFSVLLQFANK